MVLLLVGLRWRMGTLHGRTIVRSAARTLVASGVAGVAGCVAARLVSPPGMNHLHGDPAHLQNIGGPVARALPGLFGVTVFVLAFGIGASAMRAPELEAILGPLRRRLRRTRGIP